jgi:hypothetical protein
MQKELPAYWMHIQEHFQRTYREGYPGWGQFLGEAAEIPQIGIHGTSAGAIVFALSEMSAGEPASRIRARLEAVLDESYEQEKEEDKFRQNARFAMAYLGFSMLSKDVVPDKVVAFREKAYRRRIRGQALWGDYWAGDEDQSHEISVFCSSLFLIALSLTKVDRTKDVRLAEAASRLEAYFFLDPVRHSVHYRIVICALVLSGGPQHSQKLKDLMRELALVPTDVKRRDFYFYDYRSKQGLQRRDYFIVPDEVFLAAACLSPNVPTRLRLKATDVVESLKQQLDRNGGLFVANQSDQPSTVDQAFVAIGLWAFDRSQKNASRAGLPARALYGLTRHRLEWERPGCWLIASAYVLIGLHFAGAYIAGLGEAYLSTAWFAGIAFVLGALRKPQDVWRTLSRYPK